jgi:hypothetical protein
MMRQEVIMEQLLNLRGGMAGITRELRTAGNGFSLLSATQIDRVQLYTKNEDGSANAWFSYPDDGSYGAAPIHMIDSDAGPDSITICSLSPDFAAPLGALDSEFESHDTMLRLKDTLMLPPGLTMEEVIKTGDYLAVVPPDSDPILVETKADPSDLSTIQIKDLPSGGFPNGVTEIPQGSMVYNVKSVRLRTFRIWVDTPRNETFLVMDSQDSQDDIMAEGIEDLQFAYCQSDCDPTDVDDYIDEVDLTSSNNDLPIQSVRVFMVSRTSRPDPYNNQYPKINAINHNAGETSPPDGFPRRSLDTVVNLRNFTVPSPSPGP